MRYGSYDGVDAFNELCEAGCNKPLLSLLLCLLGDDDRAFLKPSGKCKAREISTRPLDSFEAAFRPYKAFRSNDLKSVVDRTKKLIRDIKLLKQSAFIRDLVERGIIPPGDILSGPPILFTGPFQSLLDLLQLAKYLDPRKSPNHNLLLTEVQNYIYESTNKRHDKLLATVLNHLPYYEKKPTSARALIMRRSRLRSKTGNAKSKSL